MQTSFLLFTSPQRGRKTQAGHIKVSGMLIALLMIYLYNPAKPNIPLQQQTHTRNDVRVVFTILHQIALPSPPPNIHIRHNLHHFFDDGKKQADT